MHNTEQMPGCENSMLYQLKGTHKEKNMPTEMLWKFAVNMSGGNWNWGRDFNGIAWYRLVS